MRYLFAVLILLLPSLSSAQDLLNESGLCFRVLSGSPDGMSTDEAEQVTVDCFDEALSICALQSDFVDCVARANNAALQALEIARMNFDETSLKSALPGRKRAWDDFEESLAAAVSIQGSGANAQMARLRASLRSALKYNDLR